MMAICHLGESGVSNFCRALNLKKKVKIASALCNLIRGHIRQEFQRGSDYLTSRVGRKVIVKSLI